MISFTNDLKDLRAFDLIPPPLFPLQKSYRENVAKCHAMEREVDNDLEVGWSY